MEVTGNVSSSHLVHIHVHNRCGNWRNSIRHVFVGTHNSFSEMGKLVSVSFGIHLMTKRELERISGRGTAARWPGHSHSSILCLPQTLPIDRDHLSC